LATLAKPAVSRGFQYFKALDICPPENRACPEFAHVSFVIAGGVAGRRSRFAGRKASGLVGVPRVPPEIERSVGALARPKVQATSAPLIPIFCKWQSKPLSSRRIRRCRRRGPAPVSRASCQRSASQGPRWCCRPTMGIAGLLRERSKSRTPSTHVKPEN